MRAKIIKNPVPRTFCCRLRLFGLYLPRNFKRQIMRIKTFEIRVDPAFREHDERTVNEFLSAVRVPRLHCGCLRSRSAWMLLVIFNEETADEPAMRAALAGRHLPAGAELTPGECERFEALRVSRPACGRNGLQALCHRLEPRPAQRGPERSRLACRPAFDRGIRFPQSRTLRRGDRCRARFGRRGGFRLNVRK